MKYKIIFANKKYCVTDHIHRMPSGIRIFYPLGEGNTPKQAWDDAFPKTWWQKLKDAFKI